MGSGGQVSSSSVSFIDGMGIELRRYGSRAGRPVSSASDLSRRYTLQYVLDRTSSSTCCQDPRYTELKQRTGETFAVGHRLSPMLKAPIHALPPKTKALCLCPLPVCRRLSRMYAWITSIRNSASSVSRILCSAS